MADVLSFAADVSLTLAISAAATSVAVPAALLGARIGLPALGPAVELLTGTALGGPRFLSGTIAAEAGQAAGVRAARLGLSAAGQWIHQHAVESVLEKASDSIADRYSSTPGSVRSFPDELPFHALP